MNIIIARVPVLNGTESTMSYIQILTSTYVEPTKLVLVLLNKSGSVYACMQPYMYLHKKYTHLHFYPVTQ